ncbi:unnamed protein product [Mytilus coruscus]|uniref:Uncharacterized protein n=1 Tax=Mytilus coruscus TaxID=42192 RepID=A0A6J8DIW1_MYTCO|nr:unnamed protein product [Mytilus coruscus]
MIKVDNNEKHISLSWKSDNSALIFKSILGAKSIENISARLMCTINTNRDRLTGCAMSEAGSLLFLQLYQNKLLKYEPNGKFTSESGILPDQDYFGFDLAVVDSHIVAISCGGNPSTQICLINLKSAELHQILCLGDWCYGLSFHNGSVICCTHDKGIKIFDRSCQNSTNIRLLPNVPNRVDETYVTSNEIGIFHSNWGDNSVVCYNFSGQVQWTYSDSLLRKPYGITLDSYSNIYVAGSASNNVVVISKDGKQAKQLIGPSDGILNPRAVFFHKNQKRTSCS